jgi:F-type H+-transporting ATPase subunit b
LFFILRLVLFKPVTKFMADRANRVRASIDQAEKDKAQAEKMLAEYRDKLKNADAEAGEIIKTAREEAEAETRQIIADGKAIAEALAAAARKQVESERQAAFARFKLEAAALVMAATARLVQRELTGDDNRRYANMLLDELTLQTSQTSQDRQYETR